MFRRCKHEWIIDEWITKGKPLRRHCEKCNKKQVIYYHGGDMWTWVNE